MEIRYRTSFGRDLRRERNSDLRRRVERIVEQLQSAPSAASVTGLVSMQGYANHYRVRVGDYRLGIIVDGDTAILVRFLHRRDIYRHFP
ncbi:MAG: type II toxin-antitoxin system RelE/ParE family toxin [Dehalococcoidia bacterium]|nr:type II toxin-antitoxin system RelE/ParE family toxin [Dehalococcoidia bacterium]